MEGSGGGVGQIGMTGLCSDLGRCGRRGDKSDYSGVKPFVDQKLRVVGGGNGFGRKSVS